MSSSRESAARWEAIEVPRRCHCQRRIFFNVLAYGCGDRPPRLRRHAHDQQHTVYRSNMCAVFRILMDLLQGFLLRLHVQWIHGGLRGG